MHDNILAAKWQGDLKKTKHNQKAEWISNIGNEFEGLEEGLKAKYTSIQSEKHSKSTKLENASSWWKTLVLVLKTHF